VCFLVTVILQAEVALLFIGAGVLGILYYGNTLRRPPIAGTFVVVAPLAASIASPSRRGRVRRFSANCCCSSSKPVR
jgi:chromate transporter